MADYNNKVKTDYGYQDKRYNNEGKNKWLFNFVATDPEHTLPTLQGINVLSSYIRDYIDKQKGILNANIISNADNISTHEQRITKLEDELAENTWEVIQQNIINGTQHIYTLKSDFATDYAEEINQNQTNIKIPIIPEYFYDITDEDCIFKPGEEILNNGQIDMTQYTVENIAETDSGKFNLDLTSMRKRFLAYLKYCSLVSEDPTLNTAHRRNSLLKYADSDTRPGGIVKPNAEAFTTFFSFPYDTFLPESMASLQNGDLIYDPISRNLYMVKESTVDLHIYGLTYLNVDNTINRMFWFYNKQNGNRKRDYLRNYYQNLSNWIDAGSEDSSDAFNYAVASLAYGLTNNASGADLDEFVLNINNQDFHTDDTQIYFEASLNSSTMTNSRNVRVRDYADKRVLLTYDQSALKAAKQAANPFGALFVYCEKIATITDHPVWETTSAEAEIAPYEYNISNIQPFIFSSIVDKDMTAPVVGDYIYNHNSTEIVRISSNPNISQNNPLLTTCLTEPIKKQKLGVFRNEECWEYTHLKGYNTLVKFNNKQIIENKLSEIYSEYPDVSAYDFTDPINNVYDFNALYFLQSEILANENLDLSNTNKIQVLLNNFIKEKDIIIGDNKYYEIVKKTYSLSELNYPNYHIFAKEISQIVPDINPNYIIDLGLINFEFDSENQKYIAQLTSEENLFQNIWDVYDEGRQIISLRFKTRVLGPTLYYNLPLYSAQTPTLDTNQHIFTNRRFFQNNSNNYLEITNVSIKANNQIDITFSRTLLLNNDE